jgi:hypothetical protein
MILFRSAQDTWTTLIVMWWFLIFISLCGIIYYLIWWGEQIHKNSKDKDNEID